MITGLRANPASPPALAGLSGSLVAVAGFNAGGIIAGTGYGSEASGVRPASLAEFNHPDAFVLSDGAGTNRHPARGGTDSGEVAQPLTAAEVRAVDETGGQIAVLGRLGSRPFNRAETERFFRLEDGTPYRVTDRVDMRAWSPLRK